MAGSKEKGNNYQSEGMNMRNIKRYDFIEGEEWVCFRNIGSKTGSGGHNIKEYYVSLDMAKELCLVQNNLKGRWPKIFFIQSTNYYLIRYSIFSAYIGGNIFLGQLYLA